MLKFLLKKQLSEIFRNYFYDTKKTAPAPKRGSLATFSCLSLSWQAYWAECLPPFLYPYAVPCLPPAWIGCILR